MSRALWTMSELSGMTTTVAARIEDIAGVVQITSIALLVATGISFLAWIHRAVVNARTLGYPVSVSPGEAVGYWFVPTTF